MQEQIPVTILMATFNGGSYLVEQLESILQQTHENWKLVIRDDHSTDDTLKIIKTYSEKDPRICNIDYGTAGGSACKNFAELVSWALKHTNSYILFSDQDDIWKSDKIEQSLKAVLQLENEYGKELPVLCYTRFQFINADGEQLPQKLSLPGSLELRVLLNENHAWGCTMILNQAALKTISPVPFDAVNHDYWIALVITALGKTRLIPEELILYRQHAANVSGNVDNMSFSARFRRYFLNRSVMLIPLRANLLLIRTFYQRYQNQLSADQKRMVSAFLKAYQISFWKLTGTLFKYHIFKIGLAKNAAYLYTLFLLRSKVVESSKLTDNHESSLR